MDEKIIQDWLAESSSLSPGDVSSFASSLKHNTDLTRALFVIFDEHTKFHNLIEPISKQLFNFYRSKESELKLFTLQFLPNLIYIYLNSVAKGDKKSYHSIETLLIGIYNLEVVDETGQPAVVSFRLPSLAQASIYHEPMSLAHVSLTESALRRLEECNTKLISWGPHPQVETLNAQNRLRTITKLLFIYNRHIGSFDKLSLKYLCKVSSSLACQGFGGSISCQVSPKPEGSKVEKHSRIPVSFQFFLELLCGLYYAMYNDFGKLALQAVDDIYNRSCYECFASVIAVTNAIKNSAQVTSSGQESEGPMGISVALSPVTTTVTTVNKFMITNASFRTKKLPDDIPIIENEESNAEADVAKPLSSITEEKEDGGFSARGSSLRNKSAVAKNLQKLGIGKKVKEKDGKAPAKGNEVAENAGNDRKQSLLQLLSFKEKVALKSGGKFKYFGGVKNNGDLAMGEMNGHSPKSNGRALENGSKEEDRGIGDGIPEEILLCLKASSGSGFEVQPEVMSDGVDTSSSNDDLVGLFSPSKDAEEKQFTRVSSV